MHSALKRRLARLETTSASACQLVRARPFLSRDELSVAIIWRARRVLSTLSKHDTKRPPRHSHPRNPKSPQIVDGIKWANERMKKIIDSGSLDAISAGLKAKGYAP
jgi:hypothetical protein